MFGATALFRVVLLQLTLIRTFGICNIVCCSSLHVFVAAAFCRKSSAYLNDISRIL